MQPKFTQRNLWSTCAKMTIMMVILAFSTQFGYAQLAPSGEAKKAQSSLREAKKAFIASLNNPSSNLNNDKGLPSKRIAARTNGPEAICTTFTGSITAGDPLLTGGRLFRDAPASSCAVPQACATSGGAGNSYDTYTYTNPIGSAQCVNVNFTTTTSGFPNFLSVHLGSFNPAAVCTNYIADCGVSPDPATPSPFSFTIPGGATVVFAVTSVTPGQLSDYQITLDLPVCSGAPCSGTPTPGNTITTPAAICPGANFTLTLQNTTPGSGVTYQWQSGPTNTGPWGNIGGATNSSYTGTQATATWYRCNVTCGANTGASNPVQVLMAPLSACYCTTTYTAGCGAGDYIANVTLGTLNNTTTCSAPPYTFYSAVPAPNLIAGGGYPLSVRVGPDTFGQHVGAWIDFNQDGDFTDPGECLGVTGNLGPNGSGVINFTVPVNAVVGTTRLRVRGGNDSPITCAQSCGVSSSSFGETEDYNVTIMPCVQITSMSAPANRTVQCSSSTTFTTNLGAASLPTIGWEYRTGSSGLWNLCVDGAGPGGVIFSGATTTTLTLTGIPSTISGYQFRAYASNPCTALDVTPAATLTVVPLVATVNPTAITICQGTVTPLTLTNATSPTTVTFTGAGPFPWNIPDNNVVGVTRNIAVAGIPSNAVISEIRLNFTMTHTWVGDIIMNLRAANGATINLIGLLDGGTGGNGTANFTGTSVSSDDTRPAMSGAPAPRTGVFRADKYNTTGIGPTSLPTTTSSWAGFFNPATVNGNWTLGVGDFGPADLGAITSWSLSFTYGAPAAGVWSGPAGTMWNEIGATTAYAGGPQTTIYVNPTVSSNYSVVYTTASPTCVSTPTVIPVTVLNPLGTVVQPADRSVCVGGTTSFSVTAPGGPFGYQWQESRDNGLTWNNVSNGGVYSGATTNTLTLTGVTRSAPLDMNNFLYRVAVNTAPCAGSFTSNNVRLTVWALPTVTISATDLALLPNQTSTITGSSNPAPGATPNWAWTRDGAPIAGATTSSVIADIDRLGVYQATVTDINGCRNSSNSLLIEAEAGEKLWIYPNPTSGQFQIRLYYPGVITEKRRIQIFDSKGAEVMSRDIMLSSLSSPHYQRFDVDLSKQPSGTYLVRVIDLYTKKAATGFVINQTTK